MPFFKCAVCGEHLNFFNRVLLKDGFVCKDCYYKAGYNDSISSAIITVSAIESHINERRDAIIDFRPTYRSNCGLQFDDNSQKLLYNDSIFSYGEVHAYAFFDNGNMTLSAYRDASFLDGMNVSKVPTYTHKEINYLKGYVLIISFAGLCNPNPLIVPITSRVEYERLIKEMEHICNLQNAIYRQRDQLRELQEKESRLAKEQQNLIRTQKEIERLKSEIASAKKGK